jgi:Glycosyltransferase family 87
MTRWRAAGSAVAAAIITGLIVLSVGDPKFTSVAGFSVVVEIWAAFAIGAWLVLRTAPRLAVPLILLGGIAMQVAALSAPPQNSTDLYRYIWDGRVQAAGIDPYRYVPAAPQLTRLRDPFLWPANGQDCLTAATPPAPGTPRTAVAPGCTLINRANVPTIYPPVAEAYFTVVYELDPPGSGSPLPIQAAGALCAIATTILLLIGLRRLGRDPRLAVLWAWCPVVGIQAGNDAHVDVLAAFLTAAALLTLAREGGRRRVIRGAVLLSLAIATKLTPVLAVPAVLRRRPLTLAVAGTTAAVAVYLPHLIAVGSGVIGFLPGYLDQEGYSTGSRFPLLSAVVPGNWAAPAAVVVLAVVAVAVLRSADPDRPWRGAVVMTGAAMTVTPPAYPWYFMLLAVLVALDGQAEWLALAAAGYLASKHPLPYVTLSQPGRVCYGVALAVIAVTTLVRWRRSRGGPTCSEHQPASAADGVQVAVVGGDEQITRA